MNHREYPRLKAIAWLLVGGTIGWMVSASLWLHGNRTHPDTSGEVIPIALCMSIAIYRGTRARATLRIRTYTYTGFGGGLLFLLQGSASYPRTPDAPNMSWYFFNNHWDFFDPTSFLVGSVVFAFVGICFWQDTVKDSSEPLPD